MRKKAGLLAVDIDGTLINDHGNITDEVYHALEKVNSMGWEIIIASGRTYFAAKPVADELPFLQYAVISNGACIMDLHHDNIVHLETLRPEIVAEVIHTARKNGAIPALYSADIINQSVFYDTIEGACEYFARYIREDPRAVLVDDVLHYTEDILQIGMVDERDKVFTVTEKLNNIDATVMKLPFESPRMGVKTLDYWFNQVIPLDAKKSIALRKMAGLLGIPEGRLVAVGDNYNDIDMIEGADIGVAMGNAPDEVKEHADVVVATNNCSGIAEVVDQIILSGEHFS